MCDCCLEETQKVCIWGSSDPSTHYSFILSSFDLIIVAFRFLTKLVHLFYDGHAFN